ncbi:XRE family transcriptional regulator [Bifidobacterium sp. LC6]|uniref:XRE family transcriptional regulator n=2 Tax=Bifidobacterium colobi TaxID=2809026 RepID=A0ABS5UU79_9BIFI|nr:XRE family transcriptional regulator [Bifidobacterium colobi]
MEERGLTQLSFVSQLNKQYLTRYHQKDVSRWLNTGNRTASGEIGFPKYETMAMIADFFGVDVGYLTGETSERTFDMSQACAYTGLHSDSIEAVRHWIFQNTSDPIMQRYRIETLNKFLSSPRFAELLAKLMTLQEMSTIWNNEPDKFGTLMTTLADDSDLPTGFTLELITGAFFGLASESFSQLVREAYPTPRNNAD